VPQEKGKKLLALSPKTVSRRLTGAHKIPDRLMSRIGRPDPYQFAGTVQTHQRNRIPTIRLDPLARAFRDQRRSNRQAVVPERLHLVIKPVSRRPGLKADMQVVVSGRQSLDRFLDRQWAVLDIACRPPSAIATACFFLATSKATKTSLCFSMVRPPYMRLGSACPSNPRSYLYERAGPRLSPRT